MKERKPIAGRVLWAAALAAVFLLVSFSVFAGGKPEKGGNYDQYVASLPEGCDPVPRECFEQAMEEGELNIYDWAEWWPEEVYASFSEEFGIKINRDYMASAEEMVAKYKVNPDLRYDVVYGDITHLPPMRALGVLLEVSYDWLPNVVKYFPEEDCWDVGPNFLRTIGSYSYDSEHVDDPRIPSWAVVFEPKEEYRGKIILLDDPNFVIGSALKYLGYSWNSSDERELKEAEKLLLDLKPYILGFEYVPKRPILEGECWMATGWDADSWEYVSDLKESWRLVYPPPLEGSVKEGGFNLIPKSSRHQAAAHLWLNYISRPQVWGNVIRTIGYPSSHQKVKEHLTPELAAWPSMKVPDEYWYNQAEEITAESTTGKGLELRTEIWERLKM